MLLRKLTTVLGLLLLCSCGGNNEIDPATSTALGSIEPPAELLNSLPQLPASKPGHLLRATAAVDATVQGSEFEESSSGVSVSLSAAQVISEPGGFEWALYRFAGSASEAIASVGYSASLLTAPERLYIAVSDYENGRWFFLPPQSSASADLSVDPAPGRWQSSAGTSYVAVIAEGGDAFDLQNVRLHYPDRYNITGNVVDGDGQPVEGVLVSTLFGGVNDTTDANGNYLLSGLPDGSWPVAATKNGWTFYDQPLLVAIDGADGSGDMVGNPGNSRFTVKDVLPNNDSIPGPLWDLENNMLEESLSALDDQQDCYTFEIDSPGSYYLDFRDLAGSIVFPYMELHYSDTGRLIDESAAVIRGCFAVQIHTEVPLSLSVEVGCEAGGGEYTLTLEQGITHAIGVDISSFLFDSRVTLLTATQTSVGLETEYYYSGSYDFSVVDRFRYGGPTALVPSSPGVIFDPVERSFVLSSDEKNLQFSVDVDGNLDDFEPNNTRETAHHFELPVIAAAATILSNDFNDFYSFTPGAGQGFSIQAEFPGGTRALTGHSLALFDSDGDSLDFYRTSENLLFFIPQIEATGETYYVSVSLSGNGPSVPYNLYIKAYEPAVFRAGIEIAGELAQDARFNIHNEDFEYRFTRNTSDDGLTLPLYFEAGDVLNVECFRFGLTENRQTRRITLQPGENELLFSAADWGTDSHEPNNDEENLVELLQPLEITATLSNESDDRDYYRIGNPGNQVLRIAFSCDPPYGEFDVDVTDPFGEDIASFEFDGSGELYFQPNNETYLDLRFNAENSEFEYTFELSALPAYLVSGVVTDEENNPIPGVRIVMLGNPKATSTNANGEFSFGLMPPGAYTVAYVSPDYSPYYGTVQGEVENQPLFFTIDSLTESDGDDYEPNNDPSSAKVVAINDDYVAECGGLLTGDTVDWYRISSPAAGVMLSVSLITSEASNFSINLFRDEGSFPEGNVARLSPELFRRDILPTGNEDYLIRITGTGHYLFSVDE
jgi:hypothetical protein